ncbi:hypothetical protein BDN70DRAFT_820303, partial [Pholiota conissans]
MDRFVLYDEPLHTSVERFYIPWNQWTQVDPLSVLGAVDGIIPGRKSEECIHLRDIIRRWSQPDSDCTWESIEMAVETIKNSSIFIKDFVPFNTENGTFYSFHHRLFLLAKLILALNQIIRASAEFFYGAEAQIYTVDNEYKLVRLLAWHDNPEVMLATYIVLQQRCTIACKHVKKYLNQIQDAFQTNADNYSISSFDSTVPSERIRMG